jgi:hypothetical protein
MHIHTITRIKQKGCGTICFPNLPVNCHPVNRQLLAKLSIINYLAQCATKYIQHGGAEGMALSTNFQLSPFNFQLSLHHQSLRRFLPIQLNGNHIQPVAPFARIQR